MNNFQAEWFVAFQRMVPQHGLSRLGYKLANAKTPWLKNRLIKQFIDHYNVNMDEAISSSIDDYVDFNDFFTRALKPDARPIDPDNNSIVSPADGTISQLGTILNGDIFQAKGKSFSTAALLGADDADSQCFLNGHFITIYLSPRDYHRVHMPITGKLLYSRYIPGKLFSVNDTTTQNIAGLFAKNERLVSLFETAAGRCAVVLVGAMMVAGIESVWHGHYSPGTVLNSDLSDDNITLEKGHEMGRFRFGSTAILLFEPEQVTFSEQYKAENTVRLGSALGTFI